MTFKEFEDYQKELLDKVVDMGSTKGKEYAYNYLDRFQNFNEDAKDMDVDRLLVAFIFVNKHIRSLRSFIKHKREFSNEKIEGRIVDIITYMTLIAGMIKETYPEKKKLVNTPKNPSKCSYRQDDVPCIASGEYGHGGLFYCADHYTRLFGNPPTVNS